MDDPGSLKHTKPRLSVVAGQDQSLGDGAGGAGQDADAAPPRAPESAILTASHLRKCYGGRPVVQDVSLHVSAGEIVGLLGPNGAGKTTTFYMIAGLVPPNAGDIHLHGQVMTHLPIHKRARMGLGYLPQEEAIFRKLSVQDNLLAILETRRDLNRKQRLERCEQILERFGIQHVRKSQAVTLSGGEKRRLTIGRALCTDPTVLMLDEPFSGVDPMAVADIQRIISELREQDQLALLITDHNVRETLQIVDRAYLLVEGRVLFEGPSTTIAADPLARKHYLGENFRL